MEDWINASFVMSNPRPPSVMRQFNLVQRRSHDDYGMAAQNGGTMEYRELNNNNTAVSYTHLTLPTILLV